MAAIDTRRLAQGEELPVRSQDFDRGHGRMAAPPLLQATLIKGNTVSLKKDKQKVLGEVFDENRIAGFLIGEAPEGVNRDYHLLERAYRSMKAENFETFVRLFLEQGLDLDSPGPDGKTLLMRIQEHRQSEEYAEVLRAAGANP